MTKENVVYTYNRILFSLKEENLAICDLDGHYANWNKPVTDGQLVPDSTFMRHV